MPVVIIRGRYHMPAVVEAATDEEMMAWLASRPQVPCEARASVRAAKAWLASQPRPSGWFESMETAREWLRARPHALHDIDPPTHADADA
ncbi:MAG: hypothetical protein ACRCU1_05320 [Alsobacter sp.]